jgi:tetratricopeptide (TPR) repeat protein
MQKIFFSLALILVFAASPAFAAGREIIFREDSGLTKTEYLLAVGQYSAAIETAGDVLTRHPDNADAYTYRGYAYAKLGQTAEAAKNFKKALMIDQTHLGANKYLADTYLQQGDVARAIEQMQAIRLICGRTDCEELDQLQREIDQYKSAGKEDKKDDKKEE